MDFTEATPMERMAYYRDEWDPNGIPEFIANTIRSREFAFDHDGTGYKDRYNAFDTTRGLALRIKSLNPYAVCASTAYYDIPEKREGWQKAELVFDIDAKDQPVRSCSCEQGTICEQCLEESKELAMAIIDTLRGDFGLKEVYMAYSGRGYHIHVLDEGAQMLENRAHILDYVMGSVMPKDFQMHGGYAGTWRKMMDLTLSKVRESDLSFLSKNVAKSVMEHKQTIRKNLANRVDNFLTVPGVGKASQEKLLEELMRFSSQTVDGKVTIDNKRILRMPSTLHSKISMICTLVKNPETFDPLDDAVPKFVEERST